MAVVAAQLDTSGVEGVEERGLDLRAVEADIVVALWPEIKGRRVSRVGIRGESGGGGAGKKRAL